MTCASSTTSWTRSSGDGRDGQTPLVGSGGDDRLFWRFESEVEAGREDLEITLETRPKPPRDDGADRIVVVVRDGAGRPVRGGRLDPGSGGRFSKLLMTDYVLPFEVVSVVLLAAMIGAIVLARREKV